MQLLAVCVMALVFGFVGSMPLAGPIAILVISRATQTRFGEALRIGLGAAVAEGLYAGLSFWGFTTFLGRHAVVVPISHGVTAVVLGALGVRFMFWKADSAPKEPKSGAGTLFFGFSISAINPTLLLTWSAAVAFLASYGLKGASPLFAVPFGLSAGAGIAAWFALLVGLLRKYQGKVPDRALTWTVRGLGAVLAGLGVVSGARLVRWIAEHR
jgi:threonine/homoserine/homoserine lactone efflux protein